MAESKTMYIYPSFSTLLHDRIIEVTNKHEVHDTARGTGTRKLRIYQLLVRIVLKLDGSGL